MNGQPRQIQFRGKTYLACALDFDDFGHVQAWIDEQQRKRAVDMLEEILTRTAIPLEVKKFASMGSMDVVSRNQILLGTAEADQMLNSLEGLVFLTWYSIHKGMPEFTMDDAREIAKDTFSAAFLKAVAEQADVIGAEDPKSTAPDDGSPTFGAPPRSDSTAGDSTATSFANLNFAVGKSPG